VVVCQNTFYRAYGEMKKFRHTTTLKERITIAQEGLHKALTCEEQMITNFKRMADTNINEDAVGALIDRMFDLKTDTKLSTRKENLIRGFQDSIRRSIQEQGDSMWALFNGITRYVNHVVAPREQNERTAYLMVGGGYNIINEGYNELVNFIN